MINAVHNIEADDAPEFISILLCCLLFKLGGQVKLNIGEIANIHREYPSIRFVLSQQPDIDPKDEFIIATLRSREQTEETMRNGGLI